MPIVKGKKPPSVAEKEEEEKKIRLARQRATIARAKRRNA